jgi:hypothetical protein
MDESVRVCTLRCSVIRSAGRATCKRGHTVPAGSWYVSLAQLVDGEFWHGTYCAAHDPFDILAHDVRVKRLGEGPAPER